MKRTLRSKIYGFTLVELLIVVAIIGVLATIGVPTFRRMVQKAKKSEAKVSLGALYTTETAFFSEYGTYGDNVYALGFELEGNTINRIYDTGFVNNTCTALNTAASMPLSSNPTGIALNLAFPSYYSGSFAAYYPAGAPNAPSSSCFALSSSSDTPASGNTFRAAADGQISPNPTAPVDEWTIDFNRTLSNVQDGIQ
jgi:type IV pilus assembly protein PilA